MNSVAEKYEQERLANIAENQRILAALFSNTMGQAPSVPSLPSGPVISFGHASTPKPKPKPKAARPRPSIASSAAGGSPTSSLAEGSTPGRRSARNSGKRVDYTKEIVRQRWDSEDYEDENEPAVLGKRKRGSEEEEDEYEEPEDNWVVEDGEGEEGDETQEAKRQRRDNQRGRPVIGGIRGSGHGVRVGKRNNDPKTFGHIPGIAVGIWWPTRMAVSKAAVHAPPVGGIAGNAKVGCWSIALSGGWADDVDNGELFTYTGSGGTNLSGTAKDPKNLRVAAQSFNQSFDHPPNASLKKSCETGKPVRVIRGYKNPSEFAPKDGYRYDGLYVVTRAWEAPSIANPKLTVCRYALQRLGGQGELGVKQDRARLEVEAKEGGGEGEGEVDEIKEEEQEEETVEPVEQTKMEGDAAVEAESAEEVAAEGEVKGEEKPVTVVAEDEVEMAEPTGQDEAAVANEDVAAVVDAPVKEVEIPEEDTAPAAVVEDEPPAAASVQVIEPFQDKPVAQVEESTPSVEEPAAAEEVAIVRSEVEEPASVDNVPAAQDEASTVAVEKEPAVVPESTVEVLAVPIEEKVEEIEAPAPPVEVVEAPIVAAVLEEDVTSQVEVPV